MKIAVGCDPNAALLKSKLIKVVEELGYTVDDLGSEDPIYANTAFRVAETVAAGKADKGILICGTGIGMSIAANKVKGAYAALISDVYSAQRACLSNDANIICLGAFTIGEKLACELVKAYLSHEFVHGTPSEQKVQRYKTYDLQR